MSILTKMSNTFNSSVFNLKGEDPNKKITEEKKPAEDVKIPNAPKHGTGTKPTDEANKPSTPNNKKTNKGAPMPPIGQAKPPAKKKSGGKTILWVLLFTMLALMIWAIFFGQTTYTVSLAELSTNLISGDWTVVGNSSIYLYDSYDVWAVTIRSTGDEVWVRDYAIYFDKGEALPWITALGIVDLTTVASFPPPSPSWFWILITSWLPWIFFMVLAWVIILKVMQKQQGQMNFGKSTAVPQVSNVKFANVAGYKEVKQELVEIVSFLKEPLKYNEAGARTPKGVLLTGPPGTGKTLFAKAVAGEAGIPFYSISGSDFVEMFVGVGASRVRSLFTTAKKGGKALIFIDELDAVGRQRGSGPGGGNDEREQTLNQLLVEMDGFASNTGIVVVAATNRPDVLDPALKRPGRFDREIQLRLPDVIERQAILKVHAKSKMISEKIEWLNIAMRTPGFSGADLENVLNEAAILSVRVGKKMVDLEIIDEAIDRVIGGPAKVENSMSDEEKELVAYHESGHALIGLMLEDAQEVQKISIVPRGSAGGYVLMTPKKEKIIQTKSELIAKITSYMGGRASEEVYFGKDAVTTGAYSDIEEATNIARRMVTEFGMSSLGPIQFEQRQGSAFLGSQVSGEKSYSSKTADAIDMEVKEIITMSYKHAFKLISKNKPLIDLFAEALMKKENLNKEEIHFIYNNKKLPKSVTDLAKREAEAKAKAAAEAKKEAKAKAMAKAKAASDALKAEKSKNTDRKEDKSSK